MSFVETVQQGPQDEKISGSRRLTAVRQLGWDIRPTAGTKRLVMRATDSTGQRIYPDRGFVQLLTPKRPMGQRDTESESGMVKQTKKRRQSHAHLCHGFVIDSLGWELTQRRF
jgi:hypothetical protein